MSELAERRSQSAELATFMVPAFVAAAFTSAFLLFAVQPLFTKMALPMLGGAPNVWNAAMVFFQTALLLGYLYAHLLSTRFNLRTQALVHLCVIGAGMFFLPFAPPAGATPPATGAHAFWLIGMMGAAIGVPFFALSANAPLIQRWLSHTSHPSAQDPYFLYAASNIGSISSLLLYPLLLEPTLGISAQARMWTVGYVVLAGLIAATASCAYVRAAPERRLDPAPARASIAQSGPLWWTAIAIAPSGLMLSVTTHLTTNVAPSPFLWVAPLSLYLLSFVFVFGPHGDLWRRHAVRLLPALIAAAAIVDAVWLDDPLSSSLSPLALFFAAAIGCHGELARRRPDPSRLTRYYLSMSLGGVIGGALVALAAPVIFPDIWEYPLLLVGAAFVIAACNDGLKGKLFPVGVAAMALAAVFGAFADFVPDLPERVGLAINVALAFASAFVIVKYGKNAVLLAVAVAALLSNAMAVRAQMHNGYGELIMRERSFFGVSKVYRSIADPVPAHILVHGAIIHNLQLRGSDYEMIPLAYYSFAGPFGQTIEGMRRLKPSLKVAVIGLGAGALACHAKSGDAWTFYELDPHVADLARDDRYFSYLSRCAPGAPVVIGDARLAFAREQEIHAGKYDLIVVDAFSSDSIPAHLITREALALYRRRLAKGGVIFFHTSNRYLDVNSVASRIAEDAGLAAQVIRFQPDKSQPLGALISRATAVVMGDDAVIAAIGEARADWSALSPSPYVSVWTDDYSNILGAMAAKIRERREHRED